MRRAHFLPAVIGLGIGAAVFWATSSQAAMAPQECADALMAAMAASGVTASHAGATADGDAVTITAITAKQANGRSLTIDSLTFSNPTPREGGGFSADKMEFTGAKAALRENTIRAAKGFLEQPVVPSADEVKARARVTPFSRAVISGISASDSASNEQAPVSIDSIELSLGNLAKGVPHNMKLAVRGIAFDGARLSDLPIPVAMIDDPTMLGDLRLDIGVDTIYDSEKDALTVRSISLSAPKVGNLTVSAAVSGLPLGTLASEEKRNETALSAKLDSATMRFENAGIVERMLDEQAKATGETRQAYLENFLPKLPGLLSERLGSSDFQQKLAAAAEAFLKDPKSITVESHPSEPVPVFLIALAALQIAFGAPVDLSEVRDVEIKTNQ